MEASTVVVSVTETKTTWASTTSSDVGGGWATDAAIKTDEKSTVATIDDEGLNSVVSADTTSIATTAVPTPVVVSGVSAWSRGSASIIKAAQPPPPPKATLPTPAEMQMPSTVNVNSLLDGEKH